MTDSYVERVLINKFVELSSSNLIAKCTKYFKENKDKDVSELPVFFVNQFKPIYPDGATDIEKQQIDSEKLYFGTDESASLIDWMKLYAEYYQDTESEYWTIEEDELYGLIINLTLVIPVNQELRKKMDVFDKEGNKISVPLFSIVFENTTTERTEVSENFTTGWYEVYFTPTAPNQIELGTKGRNRWTGFLQVNICVPNNWGTSEVLYRYDEISELFKQGMIIDGVRIYKVYRGPNITESDFMWCPVTIEWQADLDR